MSYNRYVPKAEIEDSALHKVKATYWETKHKIMSKIGKNEDEHVQASDAELDAKIEVLKSVQRTTDQLMRLINEYEYCMFAIAKSEYAFSRFLKTQSEVDKTRAGKIMAAVGRVENFSSQQRLGFRQPLERLYQECETFRLRAVSDTSSNLEHMETARNDYRASLMWMRDVSAELDPDTTKQLEKFRKVQAQVRKKKDLFDRLKLDVMQKVDMLAASRANMFSRALECYQKWLMEYCAKSSRTLEVVARGFSGMYHYYEFNVIKDLAEPNKLAAEKSGSLVDDEQMQIVIQELEACITELSSNNTRSQSIIPRLIERNENYILPPPVEKNKYDVDDDKQLDLLADFSSDAYDTNNNSNNKNNSNSPFQEGDDSLILAEDVPEKGGEKQKAKDASTSDLMASEFFDIDKADGAMAELHKRQRERTMGADNDEQLLLSLAGPAPETSDTSSQGGLAAHEELKLLDELLSVMNQSEGLSNAKDASGLDAIGDLSLDRNWQSGGESGRPAGGGGGSDLDFLRPAEAQALLPSQLLELQTGHTAQLFSLPFGPFGTSRGDDNKAKVPGASPFFLQEQQRPGLLLGPTSNVGKLVNSNAAPSLGELASGQKQPGPAKGAKDATSSKFDLFADLDPFANPDAIGKQIQQSDADQI